MKGIVIGTIHNNTRNPQRFCTPILVDCYLLSLIFSSLANTNRSCTMGSGPFSEDDLDTLPRLFKFHKQLTLLSQLEGALYELIAPFRNS